MNGITAEQALGACQMTGSVPLSSTLYSRAAAARERGTYKTDDHHERRRIGAIINITTEDDAETLEVVSPITMDSTLLSFVSGRASSEEIESPQNSKTRRSAKQASIARLDVKRSRKLLDNEQQGRYKATFKDATNLVTGKASESVQSICLRLNKAIRT